MRYRIFSDLETREPVVAVPIAEAQAVHVAAGRVLLPSGIVEAGSPAEALFRFLDQGY